MRIPSGVTDQFLYFVAVDATDLKTRETGLTGFTVYRSRDGAAAAAFTTPTVNETDSVNMPGVYELLLDEDMTIGTGNDSEEFCLHITHASMAPVTRVFELYRRTATAGNTLAVDASGNGAADVIEWLGTAAATPTVAGVPEVDVTHWLGTAAATPTVAGVPEVDLTHVAGATTDVSALATNVAAILVDTGTTLQAEVDGIQADTEDIQSRLPAALVSGRMDSSVGAMAANVVTASAVADAAFDRATFAADTGLQTLRSGTAQGGTATSITLDAGASGQNDLYTSSLCVLTGGTGAGQAQMIIDYDGTTKVATIIAGWAINPVGADTTFAIIPFSHVSVGAWLNTGVNPLISGRIDANAQVVGTGAIASTSFAAGAIDAAALATDAVNEIRDAIFARAFSAAYSSLTFDELVKLFAAVLAGKASGLATTTATYRNLADTGDVIVATVDADGNRTAVTRTP